MENADLEFTYLAYVAGLLGLLLFMAFVLCCSKWRAKKKKNPEGKATKTEIKVPSETPVELQIPVDIPPRTIVTVYEETTERSIPEDELQGDQIYRTNELKITNFSTNDVNLTKIHSDFMLQRQRQPLFHPISSNIHRKYRSFNVNHSTGDFMSKYRYSGRIKSLPGYRKSKEGGIRSNREFALRKTENMDFTNPVFEEDDQEADTGTIITPRRFSIGSESQMFTIKNEKYKELHSREVRQELSKVMKEAQSIHQKEKRRTSIKSNPSISKGTNTESVEPAALHQSSVPIPEPDYNNFDTK